MPSRLGLGRKSLWPGPFGEGRGSSMAAWTWAPWTPEIKALVSGLPPEKRRRIVTGHESLGWFRPTLWLQARGGPCAQSLLRGRVPRPPGSLRLKGQIDGRGGQGHLHRGRNVPPRVAEVLASETGTRAIASGHPPRSPGRTAPTSDFERGPSPQTIVKGLE